MQPATQSPMSLTLLMIASSSLDAVSLPAPPAFAAVTLSRGRLDLREQPAEPGDARDRAERRRPLERGPQRRLVGVDRRLTGLALDRLDRFDLGRIGAAQEIA